MTDLSDLIKPLAPFIGLGLALIIGHLFSNPEGEHQ